jgi:hypothetical protein
LITHWPWLQKTLQQVAPDMRVLDGLMDKSRRWAKAGSRKVEHLAAGAEREDFAVLAGHQPNWLSSAELAFVDASNRAHSGRLSRERAQLEEKAQAQAATARQQQRVARLLWVIAALMLVTIGYVAWKEYEVAKRELNLFTARATDAMKDEQYDRAMRYALPVYVARGSISWLTPFSTELEGKLAGGAQLSRLHRLLKSHTNADFSPDGKRVVTA